MMDPYNPTSSIRVSVKTRNPQHWTAPFLDGCPNCRNMNACPSTGHKGILDKQDMESGRFYRCVNFQFPGE